MNRTLLFLLVVMLVGALPARAGEMPSLDDLAKWEGKYPNAVLSNHGFWDDTRVLDVMKQNIPAALREIIIQGWGMKDELIEMPIERQGDVLLVSVCKPHDCLSHAARLYFNLKRKTVQICWTEETEKTGKQLDIWIDRDVKRLEKGACWDKSGFDGLAAYGDTAY
ncbi:MAG TPA: hypothetical protein DD400_02335 [Rhodospirillaceae bacterium]|nr:hypothetical protein [Rhodospirillaceae bacterium]